MNLNQCKIMHSLKAIKNHPVQTQGTRKTFAIWNDQVFIHFDIRHAQNTCAEHMRTLNKRQSTGKGIYMQSKIANRVCFKSPTDNRTRLRMFQ